MSNTLTSDKLGALSREMNRRCQFAAAGELARVAQCASTGNWPPGWKRETEELVAEVLRRFPGAAAGGASA